MGLSLIRVLFSLLLLAASLGLSLGCSLSVSPEKSLQQGIEWAYQEDGLMIAIKADQNLNDYDNQAHRLSLGVVQVADPNQITPILAQSKKLAKLLATGKIQNKPVAFTRLSIAPGEDKSISLPREQGMKAVTFIAGYADLLPENSAQILAIPTKKESSGWLIKTFHTQPQTLQVKLHLGAHKMTVDAMKQPEDKKSFFLRLFS